MPSFNFEAKESSKEEECAAICKLRGVDAASAPIALQLKAIDEEYHHLVGSGQSGKADHVQGLFLWKSKQASQVRKGFFSFCIVIYTFAVIPSFLYTNVLSLSLSLCFLKELKSLSFCLSLAYLSNYKP